MPSNTILTFAPPQKLSDHFKIPIDESRWTGAVGEYSTCFDANGKKIGLTPARERATFHSVSRAMTPVTLTGKCLASTFGVYLLAFDVPSPAFYVGVAGSSSKTPEGMLNRFRKHRIKVTSSHVGGSATTDGGVKHPGGWRTFAAERAVWLSQQGLADIVDDGRFSCGQFEASGGSASHKAEAETQPRIDANESQVMQPEYHGRTTEHRSANSRDCLHQALVVFRGSEIVQRFALVRWAFLPEMIFDSQSFQRHKTATRSNAYVTSRECNETSTV